MFLTDLVTDTDFGIRIRIFTAIFTADIRRHFGIICIRIHDQVRFLIPIDRALNGLVRDSVEVYPLICNDFKHLFCHLRVM